MHHQRHLVMSYCEILLRHYVYQIVYHLVSIISLLFHTIHCITNHQTILLWEFKLTRIIHLKRRIVAMVVISCCLVSNFVLVWIPGCTWISAILSTLFLGQTMYCLLFSNNYWMTWTQRIIQCSIHLENLMCIVIQKITYIWFQNSFMYNAKLLQIKLNAEITSYQQTVAVLKENNCVLPMELNQIITDYLFHEPVQQLSMEEEIVNILKNKCGFNKETIQQIIELLFDIKYESRVSFQIYYGDGLGGCLGGKLGINRETNPLRSMNLSINYGNGKIPETDNLCLEYDLAANELVEVQKNVIRNTINCSQLTIQEI